MKQYELIDTHCHLYLDEFRNDLDAFLSRAEEEGVTRIYMPALDKDHFSEMTAVEKKYPNRCFSMTGIHPCYVKENYLEELQFLRKILTERKFAAIGEIGLDYYWDRSFDDQQMDCFRQQIVMAKSYSLPIVIHSRNSMRECIDVVKAEKSASFTGIFHCFTGAVEDGSEIIDCGFYLGIGGVITYKSSGLANVVAQLPLDRMVLETDAPYLTPVPFRGKRNESSYLKYIAAKIAEIKGVQVEEVAAITTANALKVFGQAAEAAGKALKNPE